MVSKGDGKKILVQGNVRIKVIIAEVIKDQLLINNIRATDDIFLLTHKNVINDLTCDATQFKNERTEEKEIIIKHVKLKLHVSTGLTNNF